MPSAKDAATVPIAVERFVKQLVITYKAVALYPATSSIPRENAADAVSLLEAVLSEKPEMRLVVTKDGLLFEGVRVFPDQASFLSFAQELYNRTVSEVRFHAGVNADALVAFLGVVRVPVDELASAGGAASRLWDSGVDAITVIEASTTVVDQGDLPERDEANGEDWPPDHLRIDALLAAARGGPARDRRALVRVVMDSDLTVDYLNAAFDRIEGSPAEAAHAIDLDALAHIADAESGELRTRALQSLAGAVYSLDPDRRRALLAGRLLPESRTNESMAALVRQIGVDRACRALVEGLDASEVSADALARALRNLTFISMAGRDEVFDAAGAAMRSAGLTESAIDSVLEMAAPTRLVEKGHAEEVAVEEPAESILRLIEYAPGASGRPEEDSALTEVREEARAGITDGDVMAALVTLATVDFDEAGFDQVIEDLQDGLELLVDRGEFAVAADAAESLVLAAHGATSERRERLLATVEKLAGAAEMRTLHRAIRLYRQGSPEHAACMRLLHTLGTLAIDPLLEVLADEPDMAVRKSLVKLISNVADRHVGEVGERVTDSRWYVVRNVVSILGATKRRESLTYLGKTLRHPDARVRRETIRAVAGVTDALVGPMLVSALEDGDAQNVQLAARYLGSLKSAEARTALEKVARAEGRGNRDQGPRIEAIEALGAIASPDSIPTLEALASRRRRIGGGRSRPIAAAASSAIAAIGTAGAEGDR